MIQIFIDSGDKNIKMISSNSEKRIMKKMKSFEISSIPPSIDDCSILIFLKHKHFSAPSFDQQFKHDKKINKCYNRWRSLEFFFEF